jgi:hypothetical protein
LCSESVDVDKIFKDILKVSPEIITGLTAIESSLNINTVQLNHASITVLIIKVIVKHYTVIVSIRLEGSNLPHFLILSKLKKFGKNNSIDYLQKAHYY